MKQTLVAALLMGYVVALAGCNGDAPQEVPDAELVGTLWTLESIEVPGEPDIMPPAPNAVSIQFLEDYRIEGYLDCNSYHGIYSFLEGDSMKVEFRVMTLMGCGHKSIDEQYIAGLNAIHSYEIVGNKLRLYFGDSVLKFRNVE